MVFAVRQGRTGRRVLAAVRKAKPDAALRQKDRAGAENVSVRGYISALRFFCSGSDKTGGFLNWVRRIICNDKRRFFFKIAANDTHFSSICTTREVEFYCGIHKNGRKITLARIFHGISAAREYIMAVPVAGSEPGRRKKAGRSGRKIPGSPMCKNHVFPAANSAMRFPDGAQDNQQAAGPRFLPER